MPAGKIRAMAATLLVVIAAGLAPTAVLATDNQTPVGTHDGFSGSVGPYYCAAAGWAVDPDDRHVDLNVRVLSDGIPVAAGVANLFRQDLIDAGVSPDGTSGFHVGLWGLISLNVAHVITAQAQDADTGEWVDLNLTSQTLTCVASTASTPNPRLAYFTADCLARGTTLVEAVFFASGSAVGGTTSAFRVVGSNVVLIAYTPGTDQNADDICRFGWTGGAEPPAPWNGTFDALVLVAHD